MNSTKSAGATSLAGLRAAQPRAALPRFVVVIDEFQVLLAGNDAITREAVSGLADLARRGRSYGIHRILASQTIAGIEALHTKKDSILGQFPLRIAAPASAAAQRQLLRQSRPVGNDPPAVFAGHAEYHIEDDPRYGSLSSGVRRRQALVGRAVDMGLPSIGFVLDEVPGRHVAVTTMTRGA